MYCKKCGKKIADDSVFCQYCGTAQDVSIKDTSVEETTITTDGIKIDNPSKTKYSISKLSEKHKVWLGVYIVWFFLNFAFIFIDRRSDANEYFFPFTAYNDWDRFALKNYDFSEFVVYALVVPLVVLLVYYLWKNHSIEIKAKLGGDDTNSNSK